MTSARQRTRAQEAHRPRQAHGLLRPLLRAQATEGSRRDCDRVLNERSTPLLTEVGNGGAVDARLAESTRYDR